MTKRYKLSIGSSVILHAILVAVLLSMKIPVMKYNEKTQFNIVLQDVSTQIKTSFSTEEISGLKHSERARTTESEVQGIIKQLKVSPLTDRESDRTFL